MTDADLALARRAVACRRWRWMPGMRRFDRYGAARLRASSTRTTWMSEPCEPGDLTAVSIPDLRDPATLGCLLALVRKAYAPNGGTVSCTHWVEPHAALWRVWSGIVPGRAEVHGEAATEAEALVAALEAAP